MKATTLITASGWLQCLPKPSQCQSCKTLSRWPWNHPQVCVKTCFRTTRASTMQHWMTAASQENSRSYCSRSPSSTLSFRIGGSSERSGGTFLTHSLMKTSMSAGDNWRYSWTTTMWFHSRCLTLSVLKSTMEVVSQTIRTCVWSLPFCKDSFSLTCSR